MTEEYDGTIWLTVPDALKYLRVSKTTLYMLMKDGRLPFYYVKGTHQRRVKRADLDNLMIRGTGDEIDKD